MAEIDLRLLRVTLDFGGGARVYENLAIDAKGSKFASPTQNKATIRICNLDRETRANLLTRASPFVAKKDRQEIKVTLEAGRESWGYTTVYEGDVTEVSMTQPPDIWAVLKCQTKQFIKGETVITEGGASTPASNLSSQVADQMGLRLDFQATDKAISNYSFTGSPTAQVQKLQDFGFYDVFVDDNTLIVKNAGTPLNIGIKQINISTGMIGVPEFTDFGVKVKLLLDRTTRIGAPVQITSLFYPNASGYYTIYELGFDLANRNTPFYYIADCQTDGAKGGALDGTGDDLADRVRKFIKDRQ